MNHPLIRWTRGRKALISGSLFLIVIVTAFHPNTLQARESASGGTEAVFIGRIVSTTIRPARQTRVVRTAANSHRAAAVEISLNCATARTTYEVLTGMVGAFRQMIVRSGLGEWCDMPPGIDGTPVLVDATLHDGEWELEYAHAIETTGDGRSVVIPEGSPKVCGLDLWSLRSSLADDSEFAVDAKVLGAQQVQHLVEQGIARRQDDGTVFYHAAVNLPDLFTALAGTRCGKAAR